jgi:hypothetical protein
LYSAEKQGVSKFSSGFFINFQKEIAIIAAINSESAEISSAIN